VVCGSSVEMINAVYTRAWHQHVIGRSMERRTPRRQGWPQAGF
jgi:hypothetical protein